MKEQTVVIKIHGVKLRLTTDFSQYYDYVQMHFNRVILPNFSGDCEIEVTVNLKTDLWGNKPPNLNEERYNVFEKIGASTLLGDNSLVKLEKIRRRKFRFELSLVGKKLLVKIICHQKVIKNILAKLTRKTDDTIFTDFSYYFIYYPVFWYQENFYDLHLLHAACVNIKGQTFVFLGLEGIGKTALSLGLLEHPDSLFVSDNLVFHNSGNIYPCYQPIKLRPKEEFIAVNKLKKIKEFKVKTFYELKIDYNNLAVEPGIFILPRFTKKPYLKEIIEKGGFARLVYHTNFLVHELENYQHVAHLLSLLSHRVDLERARFAALNNLVHASRCYLLGIGRNEKIDETVNRLSTLINQ